jgi:hypothetical protein
MECPVCFEGGVSQFFNLSLTAGFSPVFVAVPPRPSRFNGFASGPAGKRLKPLSVTFASCTRLKPGANERIVTHAKN